MLLEEVHVTVASLSPSLSLVSVSGEIDLFTAERLQEGIDEAAAVGAGTVLLDLSDVGFIDSTALGVIVQETKRLEGRGHALILVTNDPRTVRVLEVTGLDRVLPRRATLQDALHDERIATGRRTPSVRSLSGRGDAEAA
jgi:anti-sigma B factor antagonist